MGGGEAGVDEQVERSCLGGHFLLLLLLFFSSFLFLVDYWGFDNSKLVLYVFPLSIFDDNGLKFKKA